MQRFARILTVAASGVGLMAFTALTDDPRLVNRLDEHTREAVAAIVDSARRNGVPTEPLIDRALEGASKHAPGTLIVNSVRRWAMDLRMARQALGPASTEAEVVAGATAIRNGVKPQELERLRQVRDGQRYAVALNVMNYLVNKGVQADTISPVVVDLVLASATDAQFLTLQQEVERDISGGLQASTALSLRGQGLVRQIAEATANGEGPGSALPSGRGSARAAGPAVNPQAVGPANATVNSASGDGARPAAPRGKPKKRP
jgi:hypothetical protein